MDVLNVSFWIITWLDESECYDKKRHENIMQIIHMYFVSDSTVIEGPRNWIESHLSDWNGMNGSLSAGSFSAAL